MVVVKVKFTSLLRREIGRETDSVPASNIADLISELKLRYGEAFAGHLSHCHIFINGLSSRNIKGNETELADGDEVLFLLPVTGG